MENIFEHVNKLKTTLITALNMEELESLVQKYLDSNQRLVDAYEQQDDFNRRVSTEIRTHIKAAVNVLFERNQGLIDSVENLKLTLNESFLEEINFYAFKQQHEALYERAKKELGM